MAEKKDQSQQSSLQLPVIIVVALMLIGAGAIFVLSSTGSGPITVNVQIISDAQLSQGKEIYNAACAACHGPNGEGQPNWRQPDAGGTFPAPPHNSEGHTWHHADQQLLEIIARGGSMPDTNMPGFAGFLTEDEMVTVLAYIKTLWGSDELAFQTEVTGNSLRE